MADPDDDAVGPTPAGYDGAVDHYTSPDRRDAVKRTWEEPASRRVLDTALACLPHLRTLRALDVGCGTADGLRLLRSTPRWRQRRDAGTTLRYVGLDLDERLLEVARARHADDGEVSFALGDVRDGLPVDDSDLYLSSGVPYSHLTPTELEDALTGVLRAARTRPHPVAVVVDVLGRYSIEWTTRWSRRRWDYRMSFFSSDRDAPSTAMTCYSGAELQAVLVRAAERAGAVLAHVTCSDRSILVGRHTSTGEYTPGLAPYRELVNALADPQARADLDRLRVDLQLPEAPPEVVEFFSTFTAAWNDLVAQGVQEEAAAPDHATVTAVIQPRLADRLCELEAARQQGLGVGHSLSAVAVTRPRV